MLLLAVERQAFRRMLADRNEIRLPKGGCPGGVVGLEEQSWIVQAPSNAEQFGVLRTSRVAVTSRIAADPLAPRGLKSPSIVTNALSKRTSTLIHAVGISRIPAARYLQSHAETKLKCQLLPISIGCVG